MKEKGLLTNLIWKFAERVSAQLVSLIVSVVLARLLLPEDYGLISMVTVFITIADVFVTSGFGAALIQKKDADETDFSSVFYANLGLSAVLYGILFVAAKPIAAFYGYKILTPVLRVMGLRLIAAAINSVQHAYVSKNMQFRKYFYSTLAGTVVSGAVGLALAWAGFGIWALVAQYMVNTWVNTGVLFVTVAWRPRLLFSASRLKKLLGYGWKILFEGVSATVVAQMRNLAIGKVYTSQDLAYYTKGQQFPNLLMNNVTVAISSVLFPAMSNVNDDPEKVKAILRRSVQLSSFLLFPALAGMALVARPFISLVLTDKWLEAVPFMQLFCVYLALQVGMYPRHEAMKALGRSDVYMYEHMACRVVDVALLLAVLRRGTVAILLSSIASSVVLVCILGYTSKRFTFYSIREQLWDVRNAVLLTCAMAAVVWGLSWLGLHPYLTMAAQIVAGGGSYILLAWLFRTSEYLMIVSFVKKRRS